MDSNYVDRSMGTRINTSAFEPRFSLKRMFNSLDKFQDVVVFGCAIALVFEMMLILADIFIGLSAGMDIKTITSQSIFLLILTELFRLLAVYLKHHRIYVGIAVEVAVVSVLREIIVEGVIQTAKSLVQRVFYIIYSVTQFKNKRTVSYNN